ncbi:MAG: hypothetical protein FWG70_06585 [Oscillospiraceae bacterium]|nr:hypothetical protein [Oscillospiraceae bacterium]
MPGIPQISNPISGKSYSQNNLTGKQSGVGGEQFDIVRLMSPLEAVSVSDREAGRKGTLLEQKDFLPMLVKLNKDPNMAVESLKQILNADLLAVAKSNGYTELYGELEELMKSVFLNPDAVVSELIAQEQSTTIFGSDKFFDLLRHLVGTSEGKPNAEELKNAVGNMLKAINFSRNQQEILNALSSNMKFLAQYFSPNKALAEDLSTLAERWANPDAPEHFEQLKSETLFLTKNVSDSLLNNERVQVLIPLIIHNLSRYNTNKAVMNEYFSQLLTQVSGFRMREELTDAFAKLTEKLLGENGAKEAERAYQTLREADLPPEAKTAEHTAEEKQTANIATPEKSEQSLSQTAPKEANEQAGVPRQIGELLANEGLLNNIILDEDKFTSMLRGFLLGRESGIETIKNMLETLLGGSEANNSQVRTALDSEMARLDDITKLVNYLNDILRSMPDIPERQTLYEYLTDIINGMVDKGELPTPKEEAAGQNNSQGTNREVSDAARESALKQLIEFVEKNIDHAAIKTLNNYNASNLLQSLINAPGVFTPLAHYIIPLDVDGLKSFGELWVDADEENTSTRAAGGKCKYHLFLTFEVEAAGHFEVDLYADGKDVNLSFFYPESFSEKSASLLGKVGRIIAQAGYTTREIKTGPLLKPHDLTQIFPDIRERRTGFNVKA